MEKGTRTRPWHSRDRARSPARRPRWPARSRPRCAGSGRRGPALPTPRRAAGSPSAESGRWKAAEWERSRTRPWVSRDAASRSSAQRSNMTSTSSSGSSIPPSYSRRFRRPLSPADKTGIRPKLRQVGIVAGELTADAPAPTPKPSKPVVRLSTISLPELRATLGPHSPGLPRRDARPSCRSRSRMRHSDTPRSVPARVQQAKPSRTALIPGKRLRYHYTSCIDRGGPLLSRRARSGRGDPAAVIARSPRCTCGR